MLGQQAEVAAPCSVSRTLHSSVALPTFRDQLIESLAAARRPSRPRCLSAPARRHARRQPAAARDHGHLPADWRGTQGRCGAGERSVGPLTRSQGVLLTPGRPAIAGWNAPWTIAEPTPCFWSSLNCRRRLPHCSRLLRRCPFPPPSDLLALAPHLPAHPALLSGAFSAGQQRGRARRRRLCAPLCAPWRQRRRHLAAAGLWRRPQQHAG